MHAKYVMQSERFSDCSDCHKPQALYLVNWRGTCSIKSQLVENRVRSVRASGIGTSLALDMQVREAKIFYYANDVLT